MKIFLKNVSKSFLRRKTGRVMMFILLIALLGSCSRTKPMMLPPVTDTPTETYLYGKFVWFDLLTEDVPAVKNFYGELFGWKFENSAEKDSKFTLIRLDGKPIAGIVYHQRSGETSETRWISYVSVPDVDKAVQELKNKGGKVYQEPANFHHRGRLAVVGDPQGAIFAFLKAAGGDPIDKAEPIKHFWLWNELLTQDPEAAVAFYESLLGYRNEALPSAREGINYYVLKQDNKARAGIVKAPWETLPPNWLPYILVDDPAPIVAKVESLGGRIILAPDKDIRNGSVAVIADPTGGAVAIQKWPFNDEKETGGSK